MTAPSSLAERAYVDLREEIIGVRLPPGTLLREDELMARLGVGRTPVREAVQRLQRDGFVTVIPRRGTLVSEISITDLAAIYEVRKQLESWASRLAAERATARRPRARRAALIDELAALTAHDDYPTLLDGRPPHPPLRLPHDQERRSWPRRSTSTRTCRCGSCTWR